MKEDAIGGICNINLEITNGYKPEDEEPLARPRRSWKENAKMDFKETGYEGVEWINLAKDRELRMVDFLAERLPASRDGLRS
jgi:hypothetical protein